MMNYRCTVCGCYLDPGEGRICEECQMKIKKIPQMLEHPQDQSTAEAVQTQVHNNMAWSKSK